MCEYQSPNSKKCCQDGNGKAAHSTVYNCCLKCGVNCNKNQEKKNLEPEKNRYKRQKIYLKISSFQTLKGSKKLKKKCRNGLYSILEPKKEKTLLRISDGSGSER